MHRRRKLVPLVEIVGDENLHLLLEDHHLLRIQKAFLNEETKELDQQQLKRLLYDVARLKYDEKLFEKIFSKIDTNGDGSITWDEFISHLILGFKHREIISEYQDLDAPISRPYRLLRSNHRHPINRVIFFPTMKLDRSVNFSDGSYVTCSKDGNIGYWSLDMTFERSVQSKCPDLKVADTWVTDIVCLPDVSVICTSSSERDVRFYDTSAGKFDLRVVISSWDYAVVTMSYVIAATAEEDSMVITGDMGGNVKVILFNSVARGPFKSKLGEPLAKFRYENLVKGLIPGFKLVEFRRVHTDWVRQVAYYPSLNLVVSCAACPKVAVQMLDLHETKRGYTYRIAKGAYCFALAEGVHLMATGSSDGLVRVWNPFVPKRPSIVFVGHHTGIVGVVFQDGAKTLCSISKDKYVKIWDVAAQTCIQTYTDLPPELGEHTDMTLLYNPDSRQLILGSVMIVTLHLCPTQSGEHTDGNTHSSAISVMLYNPLFETILTCSLDSLIIVWDPWKGRRMSVMRQAHTRFIHGEVIPVEITAATFDPCYQYLLTGAHDGSLKVWNFNTGTCLRNLRIEKNCEVTGVVWVKGRILAIGWNRHVTEFADSDVAAGPGGSFSKNWDTNHTEDVLCIAARVPQTLVTSSYIGELVMWQLETGQAYKCFNVINPTNRIKIQYKTGRRDKHKKPKYSHSTGAKKLLTSNKPTGEVSKSVVHSSSMQPPPQVPGGTLRSRRLTVVQIPKSTVPIRGMAVRALLFLDTRPMAANVGSLLVSLENGSIQVWSHHVSGGFITAFSAIHKGGDYVVSMATDKNNEYLFTGTTNGYIKTWLIKDYGVPDEVKVCMPAYRLIFPFMWKDLFEGKAKRAARGQLKPRLLNCYRGHRMLVSDLAYIDQTKILASASADFSARLWTLGGRYLGTLGTFKPWKDLNSEAPPGEDYEYTVPPDIKRVASSTTMKVLIGGQTSTRLTKKQMLAMQKRDEVTTNVTKGVFGERLTEPMLGQHWHLPERTTHRHEITLDISFPYIPVYRHMIRPLPEEIPQPKPCPYVVEPPSTTKKKEK